ncbi:Phosphate transport system permease protein PstC [Vibrio stylophorae]|uniref:Phosphate transport system permease protein PstC n=1 Tax=Vibrio stylophorae TaxID=659351 RepID=A0ABM8ZX70_9VIBR|nr:ABC transporter permease subunit [Vibrio stylophorae]CAH0535296.1 Phosphate transport system permease protein PstC [Vibrio stylophorae]
MKDEPSLYQTSSFHKASSLKQAAASRASSYGDHLFLRLWSWACAFLLFTVILSGVCFIVVQAWPALGVSLFFGDSPPWAAFWGDVPIWEGIWPACVGTLTLICLTLAIALLPGIGTGIWLARSHGRRQQLLRFAIELLAGIPSILMGLFGFTLILFLRATFWPEANVSLLLSATCLALLIIPYLAMTTQSALSALPESLAVTAAALGMRPWQVLWYVQLPQAKRGIISGIMLSLGRAAEDTAVIMLTGAVANAGLPAGILERFEALPFAIFYYSAQYQSEQELQMAFGAALILLCATAVIFACAGLLMQRSLHLEEKSQ